MQNCSVDQCCSPANARGLCKIHYGRWYANQNAEKARIRATEWRNANLERARAHDRVRAATRRKTDAGRKYFKAKCAERRAKKLKATVGWANVDAIARIYAGCPPGYHVDHIIPLRGKNVSGLHVEANLQYLPASENFRKHNKF